MDLKTVYSLTNYDVLCYKKTKNVLRQIRKTTKNHPLEMAKKNCGNVFLI